MKYVLPIAASALAGLAATSAPAAVINFNLSPPSFTSYSEAGATITAAGQNISTTGTPNGTNGILSEGSPRAEFRADFAGGAIGVVSIDLGDFNSDADLLFLEAFNSSNVLLGSATLAISADDSVMHTLSVNFANISYVAFGARAPSVNGSSAFADNLTFTLGGAVPEPATWAMMIAGFGLVGAATRRRAVARAIA